MHAAPSLQNVFDKSKLIPSRNLSKTLIPSIKNLNLFNKSDSKKGYKWFVSSKKAKRKRFSSSVEKM